MDPDLTALYHHDAIARRIVDTFPEETFRRWYELGLKGDSENKQALEGLNKYAEKLEVDNKVQEGEIWGGLFGGCLLIMGIDDGQDPSMPVNEKNIRCVDFLNLIDRRFVWPFTYYADPAKPNFGEVETYRITNIIGSQTAVSIVHESRCIRFDGARTDLLERRMLAGWTYSILQAPFDQMRAFATAYQGVANLTTDASQGVFTMKGLYSALSKDATTLQARMNLIEMSRSSARAVVIDSDGEKFERVATSFAGLPDVLDRFMMLLSSATEIPVTLLMGRSAAGMNATGDADFRHFYDVVAKRQRDIYSPKLKRIYHILSVAKDTPTKIKDPEFIVKWRPLWQPTDLEQADIELKHAQKDQIYIQEGVYTPEECAIQRFGTGEWSGHMEIDPEERKSALTDLVKYQPYANDPTAQVPQEEGQGGEPNNPAVPAPGPSPDEREREGKVDAVRTDFIRKVGSKFVVFSESGKRLGEYDTEVEAKKRLGQIEYFKHEG